ncbi:hypothetical protein ESB00_11580 [Oleiharenicola lentus]|uniref:Uncharacterized protein n=1 Tax=Oleiharenicola lentus TaxID=2508720 RepID=A0A4Q1CBL2_9BACT|nr:hypothetical protein [Oleiharenicola lentus]RXK56474.1 hypothetical protein ESB00_11580 [Oleiharenicola lentus]
MKLTWHIVWKDFRRLALPLALWLGLTLAHTFLLAAYWGDNQVGGEAFEGLRYYAFSLGALIMGVGFVLAAWLVMEDNLVSTRAFWPTRPISGGRLLAAKALGAILMFSVAPVLVLLPVWIGCRFSGYEIGCAAWQLASSQGLCSVAAFVIAAVTANSRQFLVRAVGAAIILPMLPALPAILSDKLGVPQANLSPGVLVSQSWLILATAFIAPLVLIVHQYLSRLTWRSWALGGLALVVIVVLPFIWKWDISDLVQPSGGQDIAEEAYARNVKVAIVNSQISPSMSSPERRHIVLAGTVSGASAGTYVQFKVSRAEWRAGDRRVALPRFMRPRPEASQRISTLALQVAGLSLHAQEEESAPWSMETDEEAGSVATALRTNRSLAVTLDLNLMRGQVVGELPLQVGAELRTGACLTRLIGLERDGEKISVRLEDRDFSSNILFASTRPGGGPSLIPHRPGEDCFILVYRGPVKDVIGGLQATTGGKIGALHINAIMVGQRALNLTVPARQENGTLVEIPDWEKDSVLLQVRFRPDVSFTRLLTTKSFAP